jgi:Cys-tRNA(Pro) deacylase
MIICPDFAHGTAEYFVVVESKTEPLIPSSKQHTHSDIKNILRKNTQPCAVMPREVDLKLVYLYKKEMKDIKPPSSPAIHFLNEHSVSYTPHLYEYEERGGTAVSSKKLGIPEHNVIKTLIMQTETKDPLIVLMHGDKQVSLKTLARHIGVKAVAPCSPDVAHRHSGYQVGGTSPFGTRRKMPVYLQSSIADLKKIYINGGGKGFLVSLDPKDLIRILAPTFVDVSIEPLDRAQQ